MDVQSGESEEKKVKGEANHRNCDIQPEDLKYKWWTGQSGVHDAKASSKSTVFIMLVITKPDQDYRPPIAMTTVDVTVSQGLVYEVGRVWTAQSITTVTFTFCSSFRLDSSSNSLNHTVMETAMIAPRHKYQLLCPPVGWEVLWSVYVSVCLYICLSTHVSKTTSANFIKFCEHANCSRGSLLWHRRNMYFRFSGWRHIFT